MRLLLLICAVATAGCSELPRASSFKDATCTEKATNRSVEARAYQPEESRPVRWYEWQDDNGMRREINASNSDQWSCKVDGERG